MSFKEAVNNVMKGGKGKYDKKAAAVPQEPVVEEPGEPGDTIGGIPIGELP
jgi:hypothetical protein